MEFVITTRTRSIGIDQEVTGLSDFDYFSLLPNYYESFGLISDNSMKMLPLYRKKEIENNSLLSLDIKYKHFILNREDRFSLYSIKNITPVLYEVPGYNCIINFKVADYHIVKTLKSFFFRDNNFTDDDFDALEFNTDYLICSYYEGEASFIYTKDRFVPKILDDFNKLCVEKSGITITIEEL